MFFSTLASGLKTDIILALHETPMSVGNLAEKLGQERSKVSHGLRLLQRCEFVHARKDGRKRIYHLNKQTIEPLLRLVANHVKTYCKECSI